MPPIVLDPPKDDTVPKVALSPDPPGPPLLGPPMKLAPAADVSTPQPSH